MKSFKRNLTIATLALVALVCGAFGFAACGDDGKPTSALQYKDMGDYYEVSKLGITPAKNIYIPDTYNGKPVKSIGGGAFYRHVGITSVHIPDSIEAIGDGAFSKCESLMTITIPASVTTMGWNVFNECDLLTIYCEAVTRPEGYSVRTTPEEEDYIEWNSSRPVVWDCKNNDVADDGNIYTIIDDVKYALRDGNATVEKQSHNLEGKIEIPKSITHNKNTYSVTAIGNNAFNDVRGITEITLTDSITSIGDYSFSKTYGIKDELTIPDSVTSIGSYAFQFCSALRSMPRNAVSFGEGAFAWCGIKSATIPDGVTAIPDKMFETCHSLTSVVIPDSVISIGAAAFDGCSELASVTLGRGVTSIGGGAFDWCKELKSITLPDSITSIGGGAFSFCLGLTDITLPEGVTSISERTFWGCTALKSITIGKGVTDIGNSAFDECEALDTVNYSGTEEDWGKITVGYGNDCLKNATINFK